MAPFFRLELRWTRKDYAQPFACLIGKCFVLAPFQNLERKMIPLYGSA